MRKDEESCARFVVPPFFWKNKKTPRKAPAKFHSSTPAFADIDYSLITEDAEFPLSQKPLFRNCLQEVRPNPESLRDLTHEFYNL
ncbi:MAG: hypothetical protein US25_C0030G0005 [Candidatus Moranbacteria bacterium GW2011_GWE1_36_7]|nr:MAG: hypothetical protein US16_C0039G0005 [Candidatus Moranbacteria bacterium GW2011_GWE2_36_40]KKQ14083.1 MAG: hypothetical protein US25_C0030G0005 [Candidatus Moranbacteria bacterium GW2011_GWE1_36_7]